MGVEQKQKQRATEILAQIARTNAALRGRRHYIAAIAHDRDGQPRNVRPILYSVFQPLDAPELKAYYGRLPQHSYLTAGKWTLAKDYGIPLTEQAENAIFDQFELDFQLKPVRKLRRLSGWIAPTGEVYSTGLQSHYPVARHLAFVQYGEKPDQPEEFLCHQGWLILYEAGVVNWKGLKSRWDVRPAPAQMRVLRRLRNCTQRAGAAEFADSDQGWVENLDQFIRLFQSNLRDQKKAKAEISR